MDGTFSIGNTRISYTVKVAPRSKRLRLSADKSGVIVLVPPSAPEISEEEVLGLLHEHRAWVLTTIESLAEKSDGHTPTLARFRSGGKVMYLGHSRLLSIKNGAQNRVVQHDTHTISIEVTAIPFSPAAEALAAEAVESWKRNETERICGALAAEYAANIALPPPPVRAMQSNRYWGLCEPDGTLKFDWRLIEQEPRQIERIVAHEVAHLIERNHSDKFQAISKQIVSAQHHTWQEVC
jgi:predicted metal-dependent hydrolase